MSVSSKEQVLHQLPKSIRDVIHHFRDFSSVDSTNNYLLGNTKNITDGFQVCLADMQHAGRGRRGKVWISPPGSSLYLSVSTKLKLSLNALTGLSLAVGVMIVAVLRNLGVSNAGVKWPNDIYVDNKKLGGILVDISSDKSGSSFVVIGLGLNINMPVDTDNTIDQPWQDLKNSLGENVPDRNYLAMLCIKALINGINSYEKNGLADFVHQFEKFDVIKNAPVRVQLENNSFEGVAVGINNVGNLLVEVQQGLKEVSSGDVSIRRL